MERYHTLEFPFRPKPKERPRMGKSGQLYTPKATTLFEVAVREHWNREIGQNFAGPVAVALSFWTDHFEVTVNETPASTDSPKADIDNLVKSVLDGLRGAAYHDDSQVVALEAYK